MAGTPPPSKIMIIRHAEKPPNPPNTKFWPPIKPVGVCRFVVFIEAARASNE